MKIPRKRFMMAMLSFACLFFASAAVYAKGEILKLRVEGVINPVIGDYVKEGIAKAKETEAALVLIELDTPGGLLDSTRTMIGEMINSDLPVVVYVAPQGARATSAGVFITMASDVAAMAPGTHLGAAHPVTVGGNDDKPSLRKFIKDSSTAPSNGSVMEEKMVSDASAYIRSLAASKGRNADWAERAVRESVSLTAEEALKEKVIEIISSSEQELLKTINGRTVNKNNKKLTIESTGAVVAHHMRAVQKILHKVAHPNVAYILLTIGIYGLIYELAAPGIGLGGAVGVICLLLAFFSLQVLPITTVGVVLIILGILMLVLELVNPTHGLLTIGGLLSFALGSFFLIDIKTPSPYGRISLELIISTVLVTGGFFGFVIQRTLAAGRAQPKVGKESLIGLEGVAEEDIAPEGLVDMAGELWTARSVQPIKKGDRVKVLSMEGNKIIVEKL